jgi:hypothetical protein
MRSCRLVGEVEDVEVDRYPTNAATHLEWIDSFINEVTKKLRPCALLQVGRVPNPRLPGSVVAARPEGTVRNDLLILLRRMHGRDDVERIVVLLAPWMEPEPVCYAINHVRVRVGTGYIDGPAARDVEIRSVVACIDADTWLTQALGDEELDDGRTVAQVVVGQAEFADAVVLTEPERTTDRRPGAGHRARPPRAGRNHARLMRMLASGYSPGSCEPATTPPRALAKVVCTHNGDPAGPTAATYTLVAEKASLRPLFDDLLRGSTIVTCPGNIQSPGPWRRNATPQQVSGTLV